MNLACLLNQAARFSVPLFLLLSGFSLEQTGRQVPYLTFLRTRSARVLPPYLGWVLLYALANTGFDLHTWGGQLGNPPWLLRELLTGQGAPHLYFIPILFQCYLLYPLLRRWGQAISTRWGRNWSAGGKWNPPEMQSLRREPSLRDVVSHFGMSWDARGLETIQNGKNDDT